MQISLIYSTRHEYTLFVIGVEKRIYSSKQRHLTLRGQRANLGAGRAHRAHAIGLERGELRAQLRNLSMQLAQLLLRGRQLLILEARRVVLGALSGALQRGQSGRVRGGGGAVGGGLLNEGGGASEYVADGSRTRGGA